jgi:serine/threonine-protein kinase
LAECYEKTGRTASAWATFREAASAASAAGQGDRARQGKARADRLEPLLSKLTVSVATENKSIPGFQVTRSGEVVQTPLFDAAVPVDPGNLVIEATAPGYEPVTKTVTVPGNGGRAQVQIPALVPTPGTTPVPAAGGGAAAGSPSQAGQEQGQQNSALTQGASTNDGSTQRTVGVVVMGVGAAGLVVGTIFGVDALQKNNDAKDICGDDTSCPSQAGEDLSDDAQQAALVSTIGFVAGGVALAGGAVLYLTAPDGTEAGRVQLSPIAGGAQFSFAGRF